MKYRYIVNISITGISLTILLFFISLSIHSCSEQPVEDKTQIHNQKQNYPNIYEALQSVPNLSRIDHNLSPEVELKSELNGLIMDRSWQYIFEDYSHPELTSLKNRENLDEVVSSGKNEFEKMLLLCDWTNSQWKNSKPYFYPIWNANIILKNIRSGHTGGFCAQYSVVFLQGCLSLGWQARYIEINTKGFQAGHFNVEVWSNQFNKWIIFDPFFNCYFLLEDQTNPLSALEIHDSLVNGNSAKVKL